MTPLIFKKPNTHFCKTDLPYLIGIVLLALPHGHRLISTAQIAQYLPQSNAASIGFIVTQHECAWQVRHMIYLGHLFKNTKDCLNNRQMNTILVRLRPYQQIRSHTCGNNSWLLAGHTIQSYRTCQCVQLFAPQTLGTQS